MKSCPLLLTIGLRYYLIHFVLLIGRCRIHFWRCHFVWIFTYFFSTLIRQLVVNIFWASSKSLQKYLWRNKFFEMKVYRLRVCNPFSSKRFQLFIKKIICYDTDLIASLKEDTKLFLKWTKIFSENKKNIGNKNKQIKTNRCFKICFSLLYR